MVIKQMMIWVLGIVVFALAFLAAPAWSYTVTDADGDGKYEVGEDITFQGDLGDLIPLDVWEWDWDDDGTYDESGYEVIHVFTATGAYTVVLLEGFYELGSYTDTNIPITIVEADSPELTCTGFFTPFDDALNINKKAKGAIPVKFQLTNTGGDLVTDQDIIAPPVINIIFNGVIYGDGTGDEEVLEPVGKSNDGNEASYNSETGLWEYRVSTKQFSSPGMYSVIIRSGDMDEYTIVTFGGECNQIFTRQP